MTWNLPEWFRQLMLRLSGFCYRPPYLLLNLYIRPNSSLNTITLNYCCSFSFANLVASKGAVFCCGFCWVVKFPWAGPLRWEQVLSSCAGSTLLSCTTPSCQMALPAGFCTASAWPASAGPASVPSVRIPVNLASTW